MKTFKQLLATIAAQPWGPASVVSVIVTGVGVVVGGLVCIIDPATLNFPTYLQDLGILSGANGLVAIGRGLHLGPYGSHPLSAPMTITADPPASAAVKA